MQGFVDDLRALRQQFHGFLTRTWTPNSVTVCHLQNGPKGASDFALVQEVLGTTIVLLKCCYCLIVPRCFTFLVIHIVSFVSPYCELYCEIQEGSEKLKDQITPHVKPSDCHETKVMTWDGGSRC